MSTLAQALSLLQADRKSEEGWRLLYLGLRPTLVTRFFRGGVHQRSDVEDLYQNTLLRLFEYADFMQLHSEGEIKAYSTTIASRVMIDWLVKRKKAAEQGLEEASQAGVSPDPREEETLLAAIHARDVPPEVLALLTKEDRKLIDLLTSGYTTAGIANELGLKPGSVRVRFHRLRQRLAGLKL